MNTRYLLTLTFCVLIACGSRETSAPSEAAPPVPVRVAAVRRGEIAATLAAPGETAALSVLRLASPVAGRVTSIAPHAGDDVDGGQVVARVLPLENEAALHGFALLDDARAFDDGEQQTVQQLRRDVAGRDIALRAPFRAVVADRLRNPGEQVAAGDVLLELFDPQSLYVLAQVPVEQAASLNVGMPVEITGTRAGSRGRVRALLAAVTPDALSVPVRIALLEPLELPLLRRAVQCRIRLGVHQDALLIPLSALLSSTVHERGVVMVNDGGRARRRLVQLGWRTADEVEVIEGLAAGEIVLSEGQYSLPDDTPIEPRAEED